MRIQTAGTILGIALFAAAGGMIGVVFAGMKLAGLLYGFATGGFVGGFFGNRCFSGADYDVKDYTRCTGFHPKKRYSN